MKIQLLSTLKKYKKDYFPRLYSFIRYFVCFTYAYYRKSIYIECNGVSTRIYAEIKGV